MLRNKVKNILLIFFLISSIGFIAISYYVIQTDTGRYYLKKVKNKIVPEERNVGFDTPKRVDKLFSVMQLETPSDHHVTIVQNVDEAVLAVEYARKIKGNATILFDDGIYDFRKTLNIIVPNVHFKSLNQDPERVIFKGLGNFKTVGVHNIIKVERSGFVIDGITLTESPNHLIQIAGEADADNPIIRNCIFQDSYEQMIKVSYDLIRYPENSSDYGLLENNIFQYTKGVAEHYYTGGLDCIACKHWTVKRNVFRDIASPFQSTAQYAVHFWTNAQDNQVVENLFVNNDRAIGFGMIFSAIQNQNLQFYNQGGLIQRNVIFHSDSNDNHADVGIGLHGSPDTVVKDNIIYFEHDYPNAIEVRDVLSTDVIITDNIINKKIQLINGATVIEKGTKQIKKEDVINGLNKILLDLKINSIYE